MVGIAVASCLKFFSPNAYHRSWRRAKAFRLTEALAPVLDIRYDRAVIHCRGCLRHAKGTKRDKPDRHLAWHLLLSDPPSAGVVRGDADRDRKCGQRHHP